MLTSRFAATDLEHGKASLSVPGWWGNGNSPTLTRRRAGFSTASCAVPTSARGFHSDSAAGYSPALSVQSSVQGPGLIPGLPDPTLTSGSMSFASQPGALSPGPPCTQHPGSAMPQI